MPASRTVEGVRYGKLETISGRWFTNFENSRFAECETGACDRVPLEQEASIACINGACEALDREARRITRDKSKAAPEGSFEIRFIGRRGLSRHMPRFLGDGYCDVLIERVIDVRAVRP
jgi:hypothetical protein